MVKDSATARYEWACPAVMLVPQDQRAQPSAINGDMSKEDSVSGGDDPAFENSVDAELLEPDESLDEDEMGEEIVEGYSPNERPLAVSAWGTTAVEAFGHEDLAHRLAAEEPEVYQAEIGDGLGDSIDTDGELIDMQVGQRRAGRLVISDVDATDFGSDFRAYDVGIDGGGASAEEAAMHVVLADESPDLGLIEEF